MSLDSPRPRVLLVLHSLALSGAPIMALRLWQSLAARVDLRIIALDDGPLHADFSRLGRVSVLSRSALLPLALESRVRGVRGLILRVEGARHSRAHWKPDVVAFNSCAALPLSRYFGYPGARRILHVHETGTALGKRREHYPDAFASIEHYLAVSHHCARALQSVGARAEKISVAPNFLSASVSAQLELLRQARAPKSGPPWIVGGAGTLSWTKGPELWLLMAAEVSRLLGRDNVRFEWVGGQSGETDERFVWMAEQLELTNFSLVPATPEPFPHCARFDVLAFTSWEDSFGLVALENLALGTVVACFQKGGGAPEIVGNAGVVVPDFSPTLMAAQIAALLRDPARLARQSEASAARAREFGAADSMRTVLNVIMGNAK